MKKRILSYGISATHQMITNLSSIDDPASISDFDAFVFNPERQYLESPSLAGINRRKNEINDLLGKKGGLVISILKPNTIGVGGVTLSKYAVLQVPVTNAV
jgi:hypothetical protein